MSARIIFIKNQNDFNIKDILFSRYFFILFLFIFSLAISTIFSINPSLSLFGAYKRYQGLETSLYYLLFFFIVLLHLSIDNKEKNNRISRIILAVIFSSFIVSFYGLAQKFGYDFVYWSEPPLLTGRVTSTFGQPNFLASYLLLIIPLIFYLIFQSKKFLVRFSFIIILFFNLLCLIFTGSRGGYLGMIGALFLSGVLYFYNCKSFFVGKIFKNKTLVVFFGLAIIFSLIFIFKFDNSFASRIKNGFDLKSGSVAARMYFWQASWDAIKEKPFFGYGLETQGEILVKYYQKDWAIYGTVNDYPDRAHNLILDILLTSGIAGLIIFLIILYVFFRRALNIFKANGQCSLLSFFLLIAISGYLISLLFSFSVVVTNIYFWLYFAIIFTLQNDGVNKEKIEEDNSKIKKFSSLGKKKFKIIILSAVIILVIIGIKKEFNLLVCDYYFKAIEDARQENDFIGAWKIYYLIEDKAIKPNYYEYKFALLLSDWDEVMKNNFLNILPAKKLEEILSKIKYDNYADEYLRAKILSRLAQIDFKYADGANSSFLELISLSSQMPKSYHEYGDFLFKIEKFNEAANYYLKALELFPDLDSPYINFQHKNAVKNERSRIYRSLGDIYLNKKLFEDAENYYRLAYLDNPDTISLNKKIADTYYQKGDFDKAIWYNKHGQARNPKDYAWPYALAMLYKEKGDSEQAKEYAASALKLEPGNKELANFIVNLQIN
ncbi:MAG: O-antigen ligase family protein [Patescibacteria group bacterium]|nr:O-antigen ligase family protein [Patescibacteria group bacterium]MDD4610865.1 O-antigen ligase family protein [Patescibacteria group bacterium]